MIKYDDAEVQRLIREAREDDERMSTPPWSVNLGVYVEAHTAAGCLEVIGDEDASEDDILGITRTRNNLRAMANQLEAARARIALMAPVVTAAESWHDETNNKGQACVCKVCLAVLAMRTQIAHRSEP